MSRTCRRAVLLNLAIDALGVRLSKNMTTNEKCTVLVAVMMITMLRIARVHLSHHRHHELAIPVHVRLL